MTKKYTCERCDRKINHEGRCLPCNYLYKYKKYCPGLKISDGYDIKNEMDINLVRYVKNNRLPKNDNSDLANFGFDNIAKVHMTIANVFRNVAKCTESNQSLFAFAKSD